jgi:hypothetical protein
MNGKVSGRGRFPLTVYTVPAFVSRDYEKPREISVRIIAHPSEIRTWYVPVRSRTRYSASLDGDCDDVTSYVPA